VQLIRLFVGQRALQTPVVDPVAHALPARLRVRKLVNELDVLCSVARNVPDDLHDVVLVERHDAARSAGACGSRRRQPERHVLVAGRVLGEGFKSGDLAGLELREEPFVSGPEETDVRDVEEEHGYTLEPQPKGPSDTVGDVGVDEQILLYDTAAEDLEPVALPEHFEFPGRAREGEIRLDPSDLQGVLLWARRPVGGFTGLREYLENHAFE